MSIKGTIIPLRSNILITDMNFGEEVTQAGLVLLSDNGKGQGVKPRWGKVWAVGPEQTDVKVGEWVLMEHGRWTREFEHESIDGTITKLHMVDNSGILAVADEKPSDVMRGVAAAAGGNFNFNIPSA